MTMSDPAAQASETTEEDHNATTDNRFSEGQEVNKVKDTADSGGGSLPPEADDIGKFVQNHDESENQESSVMKVRRGISFPVDSIVSGYHDPPDPWKNAPPWTVQDLISAYKTSCEKHGTKPLSKVLQQIETFLCNGKREEKFVVKGEKIDSKHCETFEEIFKRVQFKSVDFESSHLDDECAVALFDMIEFYDSTCHLNISFNKNIGLRGWQACSRLIRRTPSLTALDMRNCDLNDRSIPMFGRALKLGSHLTILHMENMYLSGRALIILVAALKMNETLQELFLADNRLMPSDGIHLGNLLKFNQYLSLLDIRNNHLQDVGTSHVCDGLFEQKEDRGLKTLVLWNNQITYQAMAPISRALGSTKSLETLNLGHNNITNEGIHILKDGLLKSKSLLRLGLQSTRLTCEGAVALAEYVADSAHLLRLDLRENDIKTAGLMALSLSLKVNESVTRMDIDKETKKESGMKDYADQQRRLQAEILSYLERNQQNALKREEEERRQLEERAQVEGAQPNKEINSLDSDSLQFDVEMLSLPMSEVRHRPSLLLIAAELGPQESLESPLATDIRPLSPIENPLPVTLVESPLVVPQIALPSPGVILDLPELMVKPISTSLHTSVATSLEEGSLALPLSSPLTAAAHLRPAPAEMLLSPQYLPRPMARKIFNVTRVVEASPASFPTVSMAGILDAADCATIASSPSLMLSPDTRANAFGSANISPTLLCQDLAEKSVNEYIEQIVSDCTTSSPTVETQAGPKQDGASVQIIESNVMASMSCAQAEFLSLEESSKGEPCQSFTSDSSSLHTCVQTKSDMQSKVHQLLEHQSLASQLSEKLEQGYILETSRFLKRKSFHSQLLAVEDNVDSSTKPTNSDGVIEVSETELPDMTFPNCDNLKQATQEMNNFESAIVSRVEGENFAPNPFLSSGSINAYTTHCAVNSTASLLRQNSGTSNKCTANIPQNRDQIANGDDVCASSQETSCDSLNVDEFVSMETSSDSLNVDELTSLENARENGIDNDEIFLAGQDFNIELEAQNLSLLPALQVAEFDKKKESTGNEEKSCWKDKTLCQDSDMLELGFHSKFSTQFLGEGDSSTGILDPFMLRSIDSLDFIVDAEDLGLYTASNGSLPKQEGVIVSQSEDDFSLLTDSGLVRKSNGQNTVHPITTITSSPEKDSQELFAGTKVEVQGDLWLEVEAPSAVQQLQEQAGKPDFFSSLTFNGMTQELASALSSYDEEGPSAAQSELHSPDEFERELDAMLASVKSELPWPLQREHHTHRSSDTGSLDNAETTATS